MENPTREYWSKSDSWLLGFLALAIVCLWWFYDRPRPKAPALPPPVEAPSYRADAAQAEPSLSFFFTFLSGVVEIKRS